ncbi:hypothetical protein B0I35DRAFT_114883 [Stachybotrys elegans]|uniref:Uncharacterized protein n=1 Tax=Stachybotrys elegans TaxID=80388 RepID=A0A8K0SFZ4_9HYPO|nr:hypothetical protein B0I35DRAFT_114883 [Stachybotrys elegans]
MSSSVLITGANRGIGKAILSIYLSQPGRTVISGVRDVNHPSVAELRTLPVGTGSKLIVVKIDSTVPSDAQAAVSELKALHGITKLDTVIANAGVGKFWGLVADTPISEVEDHFKVNSIGPFALYLAVRSLLLAAREPRFVVVSTELGSIGMQSQRKIPDVAYGMSKAAINFFVGKVHLEEPALITFPIHPSWVKTELGNSIAKAIGMKEAAITEEQSAAGVVEQIEKSTKEATSGHFLNYDGTEIPW